MAGATHTLPTVRGPLSAVVVEALTGGTAPPPTKLLEAHLGEHLLSNWRAGRSVLL